MTKQEIEAIKNFARALDVARSPLAIEHPSLVPEKYRLPEAEAALDALAEPEPFECPKCGGLTRHVADGRVCTMRQEEDREP
jgi:hypothetical protein